MKHKTLLALVAVSTSIITAAVIILTTPVTLSYTADRPVPPPDPLTLQQHQWIEKLEQCESRGNAEAINPEDTDGTPSYGILQFKPTTFHFYANAYKIPGKVMDPYAQEAIVTHWILKGGANWHQQFPACVRRIGTPPLSTDNA